MYHGKPGKGLSIQMTVRHGPVTLLSVVQGWRRKGVPADGRRRERRPALILQIGNTNSRYRFRIGAKRFVNAWSQSGPTHHCAIGVGHIAAKIEKFGALLGLETKRVG